MTAQTLINLVVGGGIAVGALIWLIGAASQPRRNARIAILWYGLAFIAFIAGNMISLGSDARYEMNDGFRGRFVGSGPKWGMFAGPTLAVLLCIIGRHFEKKD